MTHLSKEISTELQHQGGQPLEVVDPATNKVYVIIAGDLFNRMRPLIGDDVFDIRETYPAQEAALAQVWDDPALDVYEETATSPKQ
jgi:hypothetical protein